MNILISGINGFIGRHLCKSLSAAGHTILGTVRRPQYPIAPELAKARLIELGNIDGQTNWREHLQGVDVVIHLAARVHVMADQAANPLLEYRKTNVEGSVHLAQEAAACGVKRLIYLSSIKVNGEERPTPYSEKDTPAPQDPYGISKWEAEQALSDVAQESALEVVIIRPPLVYGPGVKANFLRLLKLSQTRLPLPLGSLNKPRSMIFIGNLISAINTTIEAPQAAGNTYLVSDNQDISPTKLLLKMAKAQGKKPRLLPCPPGLLQLMGRLLGRSAEIRRLTQPLTVDCQKIRSQLAWSPPFTLEEGLAQTVGQAGTYVDNPSGNE